MSTSISTTSQRAAASAFFDGVRQIELQLDGHEVRLPIFYYGGSAMTGIFPARMAGLRRCVPDGRFAPARLAPGVGMVTITCFEYADTDIGPYNELAIAIPLSVPTELANLPLRALLRSRRSGQLHAFVHHLPVTTEIALVAGKRLWNYPKFVADIDFAERGGERTCRLADDGEHILTMTTTPAFRRGPLDTQVFSHLWHDRQPQGSEFKLRAAAAGESVSPGAARLELGHGHPIARELRDLLLSRRSLAAQWSRGLEGILYGPEHVTLPLLAELGLGVASAEVRA